ncbi:unnamed protein product [Zymoseptoria tritici ST99CH_1A5]|uniref:CYTH domain-containing protein n=2 Tax=Zymoseptoria tritici TaxID=1047171 RepID=A0A2H1FJD5_ZYMTR|nr:unnamed protein product [Zymoseptoria tritici ST99CH_1E4]SMR43640.1 unnamed protein product [Zymoseptoria tritici ST99CH_3D1]SMY18790.1 unnamed protein product [Zymoseptoria tritici ST99CH_1A5]
MASRASMRLRALAKPTSRFSSSKTTGGKTVSLECERKFIPSHSVRDFLESNAKTSSPNVVIHDKYFDYQDLMKKQSLYIRLRSEYTPSTSDSKTQWEAKVRVGGSQINSQSEEVVGAVEVVKAVQAHHSEFSMEILRKLPVKADLTTHREAWNMQSKSIPEGAKMQIVLDTCSFNYRPSSLKDGIDSTHVVAEIELTKDLCFAEGMEESEIEAEKKQEMAALSTALEDYSWAHWAHARQYQGNQKPIGKLTAYFTWKSKIEEKEKASNPEQLGTPNNAPSNMTDMNPPLRKERDWKHQSWPKEQDWERKERRWKHESELKEIERDVEASLQKMKVLKRMIASTRVHSWLNRRALKPKQS